MNAIERIAYTWGRLRGLYQAGTKSMNAPVSAETSWMNSTAWGEGLSSGRKPMNKADLVDQYISWVYICASLNARSVATVPLKLYVAAETKGQKFKSIKTRPVDRKGMDWLAGNRGLQPWLTKGEDVEEVTEHAFLDLLKTVNPYMNGSDLMEMTTMFLDLTGEAYWFLPKVSVAGEGVPAQIWPIPSQHINPIPGESLENFIKGFRYIQGRSHIDLAYEDVLDFRYPNPKSLIQGMSVTRGIADAVWINAKMNEFEQALFENKARVGAIIEQDSSMSGAESTRLSEQFREKYAGAAQGGGTLVLPPGLKYVRDAMTPEEISFIEGRKLTKEEICVGLDVPPALFEATAIRANVEGGQYFHAKYGILPRLRKIEEKLNERLLPLFDESLFCAFDNPVPEDQDFLLRKRTVDIQTGVSAINEERTLDGKEPVEGGDEPLVSNMLVPLSRAVEEPEPIPSLLRPFVEGDEEQDEEDGKPPKKPGKPKPKPEEEEEDTEEEKAEKMAVAVLTKVREKLAG